jgi:hypothetical protein
MSKLFNHKKPYCKTGVPKEFKDMYGTFVKYNSHYEKAARVKFEKDLEANGKFKDDTGKKKYSPA